MPSKVTPEQRVLITDQVQIRLIRGLHGSSDQMWHVKGQHTGYSAESAGHIAHDISNLDGLKEFPVAPVRLGSNFCVKCIDIVYRRLK